MSGATMHIVSVSGGIASAEAAHRAMQRYAGQGVRLLFADTLIEDEDLYRFLIQSAALVTGVQLADVSDLATRTLLLPPVEACDFEDRRQQLAELRCEAATRIPLLTWIADGRHPWEVFEDERFVGNSRIDPCSKILKRKLLDRWMKANAPEAVRHVGIWFDEKQRLDRLQARGGAVWDSPLLWDEWATPNAVKAWLLSEGVEVPRLYRLGFSHNNCGGFCCKAGQVQHRLLYQTFPQRFAWHEAREDRARAMLGDVAVLSETRHRVKRPLPLKVLRQRVDVHSPLFDETDTRAGCACAIDIPAEFPQ